LSEWLSTSIKRLKSRVVAAKNILMGKPVDFNSDICLDTSEMKELMAEVEKAIKEVDDEQDKIAKELLAKKAESEAKSTNV
jgi:hypothetical protein